MHWDDPEGWYREGGGRRVLNIFVASESEGRNSFFDVDTLFWGKFWFCLTRNTF